MKFTNWIEAVADESLFAFCLSCNCGCSEARLAEHHEDAGHLVEWDLHTIAA